jgi:putative ABC transport system permease protein
MRALDRKLLRDLRRLWAQALAIALVIAGGVATLLLAVGSHRSLEETRNAYYERNRFADVFATAKRAPNSLEPAIVQLPGVAAVDLRIARMALLDVTGFAAPITAQVISIPDISPPVLNALYVRAGRMPDPARTNEAVVNEGFARAHSFTLGSTFFANLNGRRHELTVVGISLSPEFVYAVGPGDIMPDNNRFGIIWMSERVMAGLFDMRGAFNSVALKLLPGSSEAEVIARLDDILEPFGGTAARGRKDQVSHAFLDHELDMLNNMSRTLGPIFLLVSAFLVNLTLSRTVELEREQIGLLKAIGYSDVSIALHYLKFVALVSLLGITIGSVVGTLLGSHVTALFGEFFRFPFLIFTKSPDLYLWAALASFIAACIGAMKAIGSALALAPAVAMAPPAPPRFSHLWPSTLPPPGLAPRTMMLLRSLWHHPVRAVLSLIGLALATGILIVSLFIADTMENLIDVTFFRADRQDATLIFGERRDSSAVRAVSRMPGVLDVEAYRDIPVRIRSGQRQRRVSLSSRPLQPRLAQIINEKLQASELPPAGIVLSEWLAHVLEVRAGDVVELDLLEGTRRTVSLPVVSLVEDYFGLRAFMNEEQLGRLLREPPLATSVRLKLDAAQSDAFYRTVKQTPVISAISLRSASLAAFRETVALLVNTMAGIYVTLAAVIAFGVVYNSARVALSERARELASLRVLGFTRNEVTVLLLIELGFLVLLAQPLGWLFGYGLAYVMKTNLAGEVMRVRLVVAPATFGLATLLILLAAMASAITVHRRVINLDLISVLKTRD